MPRRFEFDAAARLLLLAAGTRSTDGIRFRSVPTLAQPPADVLEIGRDADEERWAVTQTVMALTGATGVLPRSFSQLVIGATRAGSHSLHGFLDMVAQRFVGAFVQAGFKFRLHRNAELAAADTSGQTDQVTSALLALAGQSPVPGADRDAFCFYAGLFAMHPRSADRLEALVADWCGQPVVLEQFAGAWLTLPRREQTMLPMAFVAGQSHRLGFDAAIGSRAWDACSRVVLRIGPLDWDAFHALLPDGSVLPRLVRLARSYLGFETDFAVRLVLSAGTVPPLRLGRAVTGPLRLGWSTWLPTAGARGRDGIEPCFDADVVERHERAGDGGKPLVVAQSC